MKVINYQKAIETGFDILDKNGTRRPFLLNSVQIEYLNSLRGTYPTLQGVRDNILKARQQGFSAVIDGVLTVDFLNGDNIGAQIISHKKEETEILMRRINFFVDSFCEKRGIPRKALLKTDAQDFLENKLNGSYIFIGTAGAKTLGRGGTLQNIHWSEVGFYPNTAIMNAENLVTAAEQQVATGIGKIFRESTGNMMGDYFYRECERSRRGESNFRFHFYPWFKNPEYQLPVDSAFTPTEEELKLIEWYGLTQEQVFWYRKKATEFETRTKFLREYPSSPEEAFLAAGSSFFDTDIMKYYFEAVDNAVKQGSLAFDGGWI